MGASSYSNTPLSYQEGDIDRKLLREIKRRFLQVNEERLNRALSLQTPRQKRFLELLPLLLHVNHPLFPGYINKETPVGVTSYKPDRIALRQARCLSRSFRHNPRHQTYGDIHSIFLMGSTGTIAQSNASDLDIWVCHRDDLTENEIGLLRKKLKLISQWGAELNLEVNFFPMDAKKFRLGFRQDLSTEDCGSSQHYLLLDEFYRTGLLLAGRFPVWWLVPPDQDEHYADIASKLISKRYVRNTETVDFGNTHRIPASEFIGAGMWQLYKGIEAAHKSILKIGLTEAYASEHPKVAFLCNYYKNAIYSNRLDVDELDPYVMIYRKLEHYLRQKNDLERLDLVRRCLYFKTNIPLSKHRASSRSWRSRLLAKLTTEWGWDESLLKRLDNRARWNIASVIYEREALIGQLTHSYRFLADFTQCYGKDESVSMNLKDMVMLSRKLNAALERKGGKLEVLNHNITRNITKDALTFHFESKNKTDLSSTWALYSGQHTLDQLGRLRPLRRSQSFIEIIAWCYFNGLVDTASRLILRVDSNDMDRFEAQNIIRCIEQGFPIHSYRDRLNQFAENARTLHNLFFLNVGLDPFSEARRKGINRLSMRNDPLSYSGLKDNLVLSVDQISINSWGEIFTRRFAGENALLACLLDHLQSMPDDLKRGGDPSLPEMMVYCFSSSKSRAIAERIEQLFIDVTSHFQSGQNVRYVLEIDRTYHLLHLQRQNPWMESFTSDVALLNALNKPQDSYSPIILDRETDSLPELKLVCQHVQPHTLQIFYRPGAQHTAIYFSDPKGVLYFGEVYRGEESSLLSQLQQFSNTTLYRLSGDSPDSYLIDHSQDLQFFKICGKTNSRRLFLETKSLSDKPNCHYYDIQAVAELDDQGCVVFSIFCDNKAFTQAEHGDNLFKAVSRHILSHRHDQQRYPCYITDLDLTSITHKLEQGKVFSITQYFQLKLRLEQSLNQALFSL